MRGLASFSVLLYHVWNFEGTKLLVIPFFWFEAFWMGVPVFLMLSIVLLLRTLEDNRDLKHYFRRRVLRIWPIYFAVAVLTLILDQYSGALPNSLDVAKFLTFTSYFSAIATQSGGISGNLGAPVSLFWTLQLEEWMYLLIPLIFLYGRNAKLGWAMTLGGLGWVAFVCLGWYGGWIGHSVWEYFWYAPPTWIAAYGLGLLVYLKRAPRLGWHNAAIAIATAVLLYPLLPEDVSRLVFYPVVLFATASALSSPPAWFDRLVPLGEVSYGLYAIQGLALSVFGTAAGFFLSFPLACALEIPVRYRQVRERLSLWRRGGTLDWKSTRRGR